MKKKLKKYMISSGTGKTHDLPGTCINSPPGGVG